MQSNYDLIIVGGGCAGLSLAMRLAKLGPECPRVAIIERRTSYDHDRTWSYWATESAQLTHLSKSDWKKVIVATADKRIVVNCDKTPYQSIHSDAFYHSALRKINKNKRIDLFLGESAGQIHKKNNLWQINIQNTSVSAPQVIDTRPPTRVSGDVPILWQSFSGVKVMCSQNVFDDTTATLMDFSEGASGEVEFLYLLPFSPTCALIEATVFGKRAMSPGELAVMLDRLVKKSVGSVAYEITYREHFVIPMGLSEHVPNSDPSYVTVGLESGGARASTGYVFQRIQRWADEAEQQIRKGSRVSGHKLDSWMIRKMDQLFLRVLENHPERAPEIFTKLFSMNNTGTVIRFMSDEPTVKDIMRIICVLPPGIFIKELVKGIFR
jgi:lycopene beta-cyclase